MSAKTTQKTHAVRWREKRVCLPAYQLLAHVGWHSKLQPVNPMPRLFSLCVIVVIVIFLQVFSQHD